MGAQGIFRHQLLGNLPPEGPIDAALDVDFGKLVEFEFALLAQFLPFARIADESLHQFLDVYWSLRPAPHIRL